MESLFSVKLEASSLTLLHTQKLIMDGLKAIFFKAKIAVKFWQDLGLSLEAKREIPKKTNMIYETLKTDVNT